jgi:hypothetical protein
MQQQEFVLQETVYHPNGSPFSTEYASAAQRFVNYFVDTIIFYGLMYGITAILLTLFYLTVGGPDTSGSFQIVLILV